MSELPKGWATAMLGDIADVIAGQSPVSAYVNEVGDGIPFFQGKAEFGDLYPETRKWTTNAARMAAPGDVLLSVRAPVGPTNLAPSDCAIGRGLMAIRQHPSFADRYLLWVLRSSSERLRAFATGSTFEAVTGPVVRQHFVSVAPEGEQERIVRAIEEAFSKLDAGEAGLRTVRQLLKRMREAAVAAATSGRLVPQEPTDTTADELLANLGAASSRSPGAKLPAGWAWCELEQVTVLQEYGLSLKAHEVQLEGDVPILRMGNLQGGTVSPSPLKYVRRDAEGVGQHLLSYGDVLFNRTNSAELVGKSAVYRDVPSLATFASYLIRFRCAVGVLPSWCSTVINSRIGRDYIDSVAVQQVGQANVNGSKLKRFPIPLPPAAEQVRIMAELERQFSFIEACERAVETGLNRSAALRRAVLKAAFDGRLVPQEPTDEPASALLERIRGDAERRPPRRRRPRPASSSGDPAGIESRASHG